MKKKCNRCLKIKSAENFFKDKSHSTGLYSICKECKEAATYKWRDKNREKYNRLAREWRSKNKGVDRKYNLKRKYGITQDHYELMLLAQNRKCKICGNEKHNRRYKNLGVDHCHNSGKIRGLLCDNCNKGLGSFQDSSELLRKAAGYLDQFNSSTMGASEMGDI